jgi:predicted aldo/keto reductase-like oxidoreductase
MYVMNRKKKRISRRGFLKAVGAAGVGSVIAGCESSGGKQLAMRNFEGSYSKVPTRTLGRTGASIPIVGLGTVFDMTDKHAVMEGSLKYGMYYWDTATNYGDTKAQLGIGQYLAKNPGLREKLFIGSKPIDIEEEVPNVEQFEEDLHESLDKMGIKYFDLYCGIHGMWDGDQLNEEVGEWAQSAKDRGLIKYFGISTHTNMADCLRGCVRCGYVDAALIAYNFSLMQDDDYQKAIDEAYEAGIGLVAIKTLRKVICEPNPIVTEKDKELTDHFLKKGYTEAQAKLKLAIEDERFTAAAVGIDTIGYLMESVAAAVDMAELDEEDKIMLSEYHESTKHMYCAGCRHICDGLAEGMPVNDVMRYLMYYNNYGHQERARSEFSRIPANVRSNLLKVNYAAAESRCPHRLAIGKLVEEAVIKLA